MIEQEQDQHLANLLFLEWKIKKKTRLPDFYIQAVEGMSCLRRWNP